MRLPTLVLLVLLLVPACGSTDSGTAPAGRPAETVTRETDPGSGPRPPDVFLIGEGGTQEGATGSFCVNDEAASRSLCADAALPPEPQAVTVVHRGDELRIRLDAAQAVRAEGCRSRDTSCIGEAHVRPVGCARLTLARIFLDRGPETAWRVELEPGDYVVDVFASFRADDGRTGDVSAGFGLRVDDDAPRGVLREEPRGAGCG